MHEFLKIMVADIKGITKNKIVNIIKNILVVILIITSHILSFFVPLTFIILLLGKIGTANGVIVASVITTYVFAYFLIFVWVMTIICRLQKNN